MRPRLGPLPTGERWSYEPKWDGFRALAFVDGRSRLLSRRRNDLTHLCRSRSPFIGRARHFGRVLR